MTPRLSRRTHATPTRLLAAIALAAALSLALLLPAGALAWTPGVALTTPFPRLGMWWPDADTQTVAQFARYDWLLLGPWDDPALVGKIKSQNATEMVLNATNACEIDFDADSQAASEANADFSAVPTQWLLTQCGATLMSPVDATATTLHISAITTVTPGGSAISLFEAGDPVVIDGELAVVQSVSASAKTLTVRRGVVKAASAHGAGTRVAAAIEFWPGSLVMDLSANCPRVTVDASAGPETWAEYNARIGAKLVTTAAWDGLMVDRSDGDESWLIGNSTARSIDGDRADSVPADYGTFDASWNAGLYGYELRLRGAIGDGKLLMTNWGYPNYDLLNGDNFEGFPNVDTVNYPWQETVFGPDENKGAYSQWLASARQPNLTTVETYEDDGGPSATGDGSYSNPATKPGFVPNYRKMRYGLATALMGDGFFSYEVNTDGHGSLGLLWFDEYDGAGRGRGWLGMPTGPATRVGDAGLSADLLGGAGALDTAAQLGAWDFSTEPGAAATISRDTADKHAGAASAHVHVTAADGVDWHVNASHPVAIKAGASYTVALWASATTTRAVNAWIQQAHSPWDDEVYLGSLRVTPGWHAYSLTAPSAATERKAELVLAFGTSTGDVCVDDVQVTSGDPNVWLRHFGNGVAVVNATGAPATVPLGGLYRRLLGTQAPSVNNGELASHVTVPAHDGLLLATTPVPAALPKLMAEAAVMANADAKLARWLGTYYAGKAHTGSRSSRNHAKTARDAWRTAAKRLDTIGSLASSAVGYAATDNPALADALEALDSDSAGVIALGKRAEAARHTAKGKQALTIATELRSVVLVVYVQTR